MGMRHFIGISTLAIAAIAAIGAGGPRVSFAGPPPAKPAAKPDVQQKKVWTNDDVAQLNPEYVGGNGNSPAVIAVVPPTFVVTQEGPRPAQLVAVAIAPGQDPGWYGSQLANWQDQLAAVEAREQELRNFRATSSGLPTGLVLDAPVEGITTDNLIANLEAQRQDILAQIDALQDLARHNGFAPGALVAPAGPQLTPAEQRAALLRTVQDADAQLEDIQLTQAAMQEQAAELHATLQSPTPGWGGNMTTDLLERLDSRAAALKTTVDSAADSARSLGVTPAELP
jgi:hypothetical protein